MPRPWTATALLVVLSMAQPVGTARADTCRVTASSIGDDAEALVKAPFHADSEAWLKTAVAGAAIGASMLWLDDAVDRRVREHSDDFPWQAAHQLSRLSSWYGASSRHAIIATAGIVGAVAAGGAIADDDRVLDTAAIMAESAVLTMGITYVSKLIFGRRRPYNVEGPHRFEWFVSPRNDASVSFPSGHTSTAFALAGAAAGRHPDWYVQVPAYVLATSAGLQRIDTRKHWTSDVIAGAVLGYAVSAFLVDRYDCPPDDASAGPATTISLALRF
ncbi:MAG TPA: phosphatase PAP2 family protein [Candidatus Krumholzibacteria bacterium]|nr:phosphatase PAP2 family protein [Candidatus Krumholzibacteria bacterium]